MSVDVIAEDIFVGDTDAIKPEYQLSLKKYADLLVDRLGEYNENTDYGDAFYEWKKDGISYTLDSGNPPLDIILRAEIK